MRLLPVATPQDLKHIDMGVVPVARRLRVLNGFEQSPYGRLIFGEMMFCFSQRGLLGLSNLLKFLTDSLKLMGQLYISH